MLTDYLKFKVCQSKINFKFIRIHLLFEYLCTILTLYITIYTVIVKILLYEAVRLYSSNKGGFKLTTLQITADEEQVAHFMQRIEAGDKIEADDWMPEEYRQTLIKLISMHGISEIMGALPEKEWVPKAPSLNRKLGIMAKVQDEMGHGQLLLRVTEDLLVPYGKNRGDIMQDLFN